MRADYLTRFQSTIKQEDIDNLKRIKDEGRSVHDARFWLFKKYWDEQKQKTSVDARTLESWLKHFFIDL